MIRLDINQRAAVAQESLPWGAAASGQLEDTCRFLDRLAHELDRPRGEQRGYELRKWISNTERALEMARQGTGGTAAFRLAADQLEVWRLSRALHAMAVGCCSEGAGSDDPCSPEPGRVIVAIHDPLGVLDSDQACARHAADHVLRWEDVMPYRLHGDHETAVATHILIRQARAEGPTPAG